MIAFACPVMDTESYRRYAEPGIRIAAEPDSELYALAATGGLARSYNLLLERAAGHEPLEALVLVHPHAEITDPHFCRKVREALEDAGVGLVGAIGATGVRNIAWWEGEVRSGQVLHRYTEFGGGEFEAFSWTQPRPAPGEVECVDGLLLVLSPAVARNVRFDESLPLGHGVDIDFCVQVREAGYKIVVADLQLTQHRALELLEDDRLWVEAHIRLGEKWDGRMPGVAERELDWRARARRAEAERESARAFAHANLLGADARVLAAERALEEVTSTPSWRATAPLRWLNKLRAERRSRAPS
jgi:Glycosyltransferase like family